MRPGVLGPQRSRGVRKLNFYHQVQLRRQHLPAAQDAHHGGAQQHVRVAALVHCAGRPRVVHLVEALHGLVLVVLAALQQVMHGHGAAVVVNVVAALAVGKDLDPLDETWHGLVSVFLTLKAILIDSGSMNEVPLVRGMRQTLEVAGEKELSELGKYPAEATDEDLARLRQGGGNRFGEDDLAGDPEADALTNNGQGPPSITGRLRSAADGAQAAADLVGAGAAAAQAFRSQLPQDAAKYVRLNVLPRPGPQPQPPPQIIGRPDDVAPPGRGGAARAGGGVWRSAGHRGDGSSGCRGGRGRRRRCRRRRGRGRGLRVPGGLAEGAAALAPTAGEVAGAMAATAGVGAAATARLAVGLAGGAAYGLACGTGWVLENTLFRPQQGSEDAAVQDVRSANNMNDATQPQHFTLRTGSSTSGSPASSRASSQSGFRVQAQTNHTPRPFSWGLNPVTLPQSQPNSRASSRSSGQSRQSRLPPPSYDQLARDIEAA